MKKFMELVFRELVIFAELREQSADKIGEYLWIGLCVLTIPILLLFCLLLAMKIDTLREKKMLARGTYHKELPIEEIEISLTEEKDSFQITCKAETVLTPNAKEAEAAKKANKKREQELLEGIVSEIVPKEEACLIARSSDASAAKEDFFRLDVCPVWEKKKTEEWLSQYETLRDAQGHIIAIRGADEKVTSRGYDILIPNEEADRLCAMSGEELWRFRKAENCKLQIKEKGRIISFSDTEGFTKEELIEKARALAESMGYKFKVKEIGKE